MEAVFLRQTDAQMMIMIMPATSRGGRERYWSSMFMVRKIHASSDRSSSGSDRYLTSPSMAFALARCDFLTRKGGRR